MVAKLFSGTFKRLPSNFTTAAPVTLVCQPSLLPLSLPSPPPRLFCVRKTTNNLYLYTLELVFLDQRQTGKQTKTHKILEINKVKFMARPSCSKAGSRYAADKSLSSGYVLPKGVTLSTGLGFIRWIAQSTVRTTQANRLEYFHCQTVFISRKSGELVSNNMDCSLYLFFVYRGWP